MLEKDERIRIHAEIQFSLSGEDLEDIVITALNGGIGYWACLDNTTEIWKSMPEDAYTDEWAAHLLLNGNDLTFLDVEEQEGPWTFNLGKLLAGIRQFVEDGYDKYHAFYGEAVDIGYIDARCGDIIFQLGLFGEIMYG